MVDLVDTINTFNIWSYTCNIVYQWVVTCHQYICMSEDTKISSCLHYNDGWLWRKQYLKTFPLYVRYVEEYKKSSTVIPLCVDTFYWPYFCSLQFFLPLRTFDFRFQFKNSTHFKNSLFLFPLLNHMVIFFFSIPFFKLDLFSYHSRIAHIFHKNKCISY